MSTKVKMKRNGYAKGVMAAACLLAAGAAGAARAGSITYGLQFAPMGYTVYTGWGSGVTAVQAAAAPSFFGSDNGTTFTLGAATLTFTGGTNYNIQNGITAGTPTTDISWLNHAFYLTNSSNTITAHLTGLTATDTVDFQFIESEQPFSPTVTVTGNSTGSLSGSIASSPDGSAFVDLGSLTGNTAYTLSSSLNPGGGEGDLAGALITITTPAAPPSVPEPASVWLLAVGGIALSAMRLAARKRSTID